ncbi:hypothetical protein, partial [Neorhizobium sp. SHOUNA12B]|uniref:hypothetical protein n=1 Tax=Neorhizobium sp. SHOUNA12B TaxID=2908928 RepID=UPI0025F163D3
MPAPSKGSPPAHSPVTVIRRKISPDQHSVNAPLKIAATMIDSLSRELLEASVIPGLPPPDPILPNKKPPDPSTRRFLRPHVWVHVWDWRQLAR